MQTPPTEPPPRKLLDQACTELVERVSDAIRAKHYSRRTEQTYPA